MSIGWTIIVAGSLVSQATETSSGDYTPAAIAAAVERLSSDRYQVREHASDFLWRAGESARAAVAEAAKSDDREVVFRATELLDKLDTGIRPDTPPDEVALLSRYRYSNASGRRQILAELRQRNAFPMLLRLLRGEKDQQVRTEAMRQILGERGAIAQLFVQGRTDEVDRLMEFAALSLEHQELFAAYLFATGKLEVKLAALQAATSDVDRMLLARLERLQGNPQRALEIVQQIPYEDKLASPHLARRTLEAELLQATGRWAEMATLVDTDKFAGVDCEREVERLGYSAFFHRMTGNQKRLEERLEELKALADKQPEDRFMCMEALMVNDRFEDAVAIGRKKGRETAFDLHVGRLEYRQALEAIDFSLSTGSVAEWYDRMAADQKTRKPNEPVVIHSLAPRVAGFLLRIGEVEKAGELFNYAFMHADNDAASMAQLVKTERLLRLAPQWQQHAADALKNLQADDLDPRKPSFGTLVGDSSGIWWKLFRERYPNDDEIATLNRIDDLGGARWGRSPLNEPQREMVEWAIGESVALDSEAKQQQLHSSAGFCLQRQSPALARSCYEKALVARPSDIAWQRLGDIAAGESRWEDAEKAYGHAWELSKKPLPLYLQAAMLAKLGRNDEAAKAKQLARVLPLGQEDERANLAAGLLERKLNDEAFAEWQLVLQLGSPWEWGFGNALQNIGNSKAKSDPLEAVRLWERFRSTVLRTESGFVESSHYFDLARTMHRVRASGLLKAGKPAEALEAAQMAMSADPGEVDTAIHMIAEFVEAGQREPAAAIFNRVRENHLRLCGEFPNSSFAHNGLAWLIVKTDGDLDEALAHSKRSVELTPNDPAPIDTLALIHHKRGEHTEAVTHARHCVELSPGESHFREQLAEFETAAKRSHEGLQK